MTIKNSQIGETLLQNFIEAKSQFLSHKDLHPLLEQFKSVIADLNLNEVKFQFKFQAEKNLEEWWTNKDKDVDLDTPIIGLLFTYRALDDKEPEANVYGISECRHGLKIQLEPYLLGSHDYVDGYYAMPGIKLDLCKPLHQFQWQNLKAAGYGDLDFYELNGCDDLYTVYNHAIRYCIHSSLLELYQENKLKEINSVKPLHCLVQQYDEEATPVLFIE
jgi:hypothetical protein